MIKNKKITLALLIFTVSACTPTAQAADSSLQDMGIFTAQCAVVTLCSYIIIRAINTYIVQPALPKIDELNSAIRENNEKVDALQAKVEPAAIFAAVKQAYNPHSTATNGQELQDEAIRAAIVLALKPEIIMQLAKAYDPTLEVTTAKALIERISKDMVTEQFYAEKVKPILEQAIADTQNEIKKKVEEAKDSSKKIALEQLESVWNKIGGFVGVGPKDTSKPA